MRTPLLLLLLIASTAMAADVVGLRTTQQGTLYRVVSSEESTPTAKPEYNIVEREQDDADVSDRRVNLTIKSPTPVRDVALSLLADSGMAVQFSGARASEAAAKPVGPAVFSGSLRGSLRSLAQNVGLQVYIREAQVEFTDRRSYQLRLPQFENVTDVAAKLQSTRAANVRIVGGVVEFDADQDALRDVQGAIREIKLGRRGANSFLASMSNQPRMQPAPMNPGMDAKRAEQAVLASMAPTQTLSVAPRVPTDPLLRTVKVMDFDGDVTEAIRRISQEAGINYKIVSAPKRYIPIALHFSDMSLRSVLDVVDRQLNGRGDLVYVKEKQRLDFVAR